MHETTGEMRWAVGSRVDRGRAVLGVRFPSVSVGETLSSVVASVRSDRGWVLRDVASGEERLRSRDHVGEGGCICGTSAHGRRKLPGCSALGHSATIHAIVMSQSGSRLATGSVDKTVIVWSTDTGEAELQLSGHKETVRSLAFSPDGQRLASASDSTTRVWNTSTGAVVSILRRADGGGRAVAWSPDGQSLATGGHSGVVHTFDTDTWHVVRSFQGQGQIESLAFSPDSRSLAAGGWGRAVLGWDTRSGGLRLCLRGPSECASSKGGDAHADCEGHRSFLLSVAWSPDGQRLVSCCYRAEVKLWDATTGALLRSFSGGRCAAFAPDVQRTRERGVAFAMGQLPRHGAQSHVRGLMGDVVRMVLEAAGE